MPNKVLTGSDDLMRKLEEIVRKMGGGAVSVGFIEGAPYPDGTPVAAVAFWNEFGVPSHGQPPRPYFRNMITKESDTWPKKMAALAKATNYDGPRVLKIMGEDIRDALKQSINDLQTPELAESTKERKDFDKPLMDTKHMIESVDYKVES